MSVVDSAAAKACCVASYSSDLVALLLGNSYHPGGLRLTRRLLGWVECGPGQRLLDVAAGRGTTALLAADEYGAAVDGVDLAPANVASASAAAAARGLADQVRFHVGDAEALPVPDAAYDIVVCECALCTFPDKPAAVEEIVRVLAPGGRLGLSDMTADPSRLPPELTSVTAWAACIADAHPSTEYVQMLRDAGLRVRTVEEHPSTIRRLIEQIEARLQVLRMTSSPQLRAAGLDVERAQPMLRAARAAVDDDLLGYVVIVADKPASPDI